MNKSTRARLTGALVILILGGVGLLKFGRFHWGIFLVTIAGAAFTFISQRNRAQIREQYPIGVPRKQKLP
ncbi:MAG: hypothetical protein ACJ8E6_05535 [Sphingomicrobium sp.]